MRSLREDKDTDRLLQNEQVLERQMAHDQYADRLIESWGKRKGLDLDGGKFDSLRESNPRKARNLAVILENQEKYLRTLTETVISNVFQATPQTIVKIIRLGYPNSVRGEIFTEYSMVTMKDTIFKIESAYDRTKRGATMGNVMYESTADRYASEKEVLDIAGTGNVNLVGNLTVAPLRPYTVVVMLNNMPIASDNGAGIVVGEALSATTPSTVDYVTGAFSLTFNVAPAATDMVSIVWQYNSEVVSLYPELGEVALRLVGYDLRATPYPLGFSWSKMTELIMEDALQSEAESVLVSAGADELKKSLDFQPIKMAYNASHWAAPVTFNTDWASQGADSDFAHTQSVGKALRNASQLTYDAIMRGGEATSYVAGPKACTYLTGHKNFVADNTMPAVGAYKMGTLNGIPIYQVPRDVVPTNEILSIYKNNREDANDAAIMIGTYIPFYRTEVLEFKNLFREGGLSYFGDIRVNEGRYCTRVVLEGLD